MTTYTRDTVSKMTAAEVSKVLNDQFGIKATGRPNSELREILIRKAKEVSKQNRRENERQNSQNAKPQVIFDNEAVSVMKSIDKHLCALIEKCDCIQTSLDIIMEMHEDPEAFQTKTALMNKAAEPEPPRPVETHDLYEYATGLDLYDIVNVSTGEAYDMFKSWCANRNVTPCAQIKITKYLCSKYPLKVENGMFRMIK